MDATTKDCCDAWVAIRPRLGWYEFDDDPGVYAMPCVAGTIFRVNYCPICGAQRRSAIWNSNTHPPLSEEN